MAENQSGILQRVDIKKVFKEKSPRMARMIPGFIYRYIKKIIHQDYVNWFLHTYGDKVGIDFARAAIEEFDIKVVVKGEENMGKQGKFIFASNHPLGGFDGIILLHLVDQHYSNYKFLVNDILLNIDNFKPLFVPINTLGGQSRESAQIVEDLFMSDAQVLTFPAGLVSRKIKGKIQDPPWRKNFIRKAIQYKRDIIPVHITGRNSNFFYNLANIRKFLRIKYNLEMFYLPNETYKHRHKTITITFGKPIPWKTFDKSRTHEDWARYVREVVYTLPSSTSAH